MGTGTFISTSGIASIAGIAVTQIFFNKNDYLFSRLRYCLKYNQISLPSF